MTSYINQTMAREHIATLVEQAEASRVRRQIRQARRAARAAARESAIESGSGRGSRRDPWLRYVVPAAR